MPALEPTQAPASSPGADVVALESARPAHDAAAGPLEATTRLGALRRSLRAGRVTLIRFEHPQGTFEIIAATGRRLLAPGVRMPLRASSIALAASEGRQSTFSPERSPRPLDRLAVAVGLRSGLSIPLKLGGAVLGAITVLWPSEQPAVAVDDLPPIANEPELLKTLIAPAARHQTVLICHEDPLLAGGLARLAEQQLGADVTVAVDVDQAVAIAGSRRPDLIVCSDQLSAGDRLGDIANRLRAAGSAAPLLVLARTENERSFESAGRAGAAGFLTLASAPAELATTAAAVIRGESALTRPACQGSGLHLTEREQDVLLCFDQGLSDKQIAHTLGVATSTVKTHARALYGKLSVTSRTAALHKARSIGLI